MSIASCIRTSLTTLKSRGALNTQILSSKSLLPPKGPFFNVVRFESFKVQDVKDFDERVINSKTPIIVDFYATWCNPCRMLTPRIEAVIDETKGKVKLAKVDIDEQTDLALDYNVGSVPVLLVFKDGKPQARLVGLQDMDKLRNWVTKSAIE